MWAFNSSPSFADLDGDGDLDAVIGAQDGTLHYFQNTGSATVPAFTEQTGAANPFNFVDVGTRSTPSFVDLDGDGDLDAVVGEEYGTLHYFENTGSAVAPAFTELTGAANPFDGVDVGFNARPSFADLDGDGDLDAIVGELTAPCAISRTPARPPHRPSANAPAPPIRSTASIVGVLSKPSFADLDGDGDLDVVVGERYGALHYFLNTGAGFAQVVDVTAQNDAATLSADVRNLTEANTAAAISSSGTLTITDPDGPATFVAQAGTVGLYGTFAITTAGAWTYTASSAHNEFAAGSTHTDTFSVASSDGTLTSVDHQHRRQQRHTRGECAEPRHRQGHRHSGDAVGLGCGRRQPRLHGAERSRARHVVGQRREPHLYARRRLPRSGFLQLRGQRRHAEQRAGERQPERAPEHCARRHCVRPVGHARAGLQCVGPVLGERRRRRHLALFLLGQQLRSRERLLHGQRRGPGRATSPSR